MSIRFNLSDLRKHHQKQAQKQLEKYGVQFDSQSKVDSKNSEQSNSNRESKRQQLVSEDNEKISIVHQKLWQAVKDLDGAVLEYKGAVPKRRFSLDIAFPALKIAVEVDGWEFHGKYKSAHLKDRERQNLLTLHGWRILRYTAKQILGNVEQCKKEIEQLVIMVGH